MTVRSKPKASKAHAAAAARVTHLEEQERIRRAALDKAATHLQDLRTRNEAGDDTVAGLELLTASAEVETTAGLAAHAVRVLTDARSEAARLLADQTAQEVRDSLAVHNLVDAQREATETATGALRGLVDAVARRDRASDQAGQALADAGVPAGEWVNGIRYQPVRTSGDTVRVAGGPVYYAGSVIPGRYNVEVTTEDGDSAWLGSAGLTRDSRGDVEHMIAIAIEGAHAILN